MYNHYRSCEIDVSWAKEKGKKRWRYKVKDKKDEKIRWRYYWEDCGDCTKYKDKKKIEISTVLGFDK